MRSIVVFGITAAIVVATPVHAQEIKLRIADSFPVGHYVIENQTKPFMAEVEKRTGGRVKFEHFPAQQLGKAKDLMSLTLSGVADIGYVAPSFVTEKLPLSSVAELPESFNTGCQGTLAYWKLARPGGLLDKLEFEPNGVRALFVMVLAPYQIYMVKGQELQSIESLAGKKIRTTGGAKELTVRKLGAVPVQIPTPEVREAASRGTIDGFLFPHTAIAPYDLARVSSVATLGENLGSFVVTYMTSRKRWDALPEDVRDVIAKVGDEVVASGCAKTDAMETERIAATQAAGVKMITLPAQESAKLRAMTAEVGQEWADALDKRGLKGSEVLKAFQDAIAR